MTNIDENHILFIEPKHSPTDPIIDDYTRRVTAAWRARVDSKTRYRGQHSCTGRGCKAMSGNGEHTVGGGRFETNSLAIHYIACHRAEVPAEELAKIMTLPPSDVEPSAGEVGGDWRACDP